MNKLLLLSGLAAGLVLSSAAQAQSYNPNYPSQVGASYYNSRRPAASSNGLKSFQSVWITLSVQPRLPTKTLL